MFEVIMINNKGTEYSEWFYSKFDKDDYVKKHKYSVNVKIRMILEY